MEFEKKGQQKQDKEEKKNNIKVKYFIQVNFGNEVQKSGVSLNKLTEFISFLNMPVYRALKI